MTCGLQSNDGAALLFGVVKRTEATFTKSKLAVSSFTRCQYQASGSQVIDKTGLPKSKQPETELARSFTSGTMPVIIIQLAILLKVCVVC